MIQEIQVENFKSVQKLKLELGRFNVLIGENGCGKSNILEAIAMGAAASADKLDNEFLHSRGVRVTEPRLMRSGFEKESAEKDIKVSFIGEEGKYEGEFYNELNGYQHWNNRKDAEIKQIGEDIKSLFSNGSKDLESNPIFLEGIENDMHKIVTPINDFLKRPETFEIATIFQTNFQEIFSSLIRNSFIPKELFDFLAYSPENSILRKFEDESQIQPLGIRGEGLFKLITVIAKEKPEQFAKIKENLKLIGWFKDFQVPTDLAFTEKRLSIYDRYLDADLQYFSQKSANEGFLFLLFYITLFISDYTPKFFAIDNIDNALNPKLCEKLITLLVQLAKDHDKQTIVTTHNPAILDGLNLHDDDQRLFVVWRNAVGETKIRRVKPISTPEGEQPVRMSEAFLNGYIGGLPKNF
jgi:predicted ATPase